MNIAYLVDSDRWDPATIYTLDLACAMKRRGHKVVICIPKLNDELQKLYRTSGFDMLKIIFHTIPAFSTSFLSGFIKSMGLSIIHANSMLTASIATRAAELSRQDDVRTILTPNHFGNYSPIVRDILNSLDALVLQTEKAPVYLEEIQTRVFPLLYSVPSGGQTARESSPTKIITVNGAITPDKKIEQLIEAASHLDGIDYKIRIIGEGKAAHVMPLKQAAQRFDISDRIEWLGNRPDSRDLIKDSAVGVELSGFGGLYRIAEYQAAGVPVIAIDDFGTSDYITDGENGFIVRHDEQLTEALRTALCDPGFHNRFEAYRQKSPVEPYDNYVSRLTSIYSSLLSDNART